MDPDPQHCPGLFFSGPMFSLVLRSLSVFAWGSGLYLWLLISILTSAPLVFEFLWGLEQYRSLPDFSPIPELPSFPPSEIDARLLSLAINNLVDHVVQEHGSRIPDCYPPL